MITLELTVHEMKLLAEMITCYEPEDEDIFFEEGELVIFESLKEKILKDRHNGN